MASQRSQEVHRLVPPITAQINRVTTVVTAADSVQLPAATVGKEIVVINAAAANAMAVFPQTGEIINALSANASISVAANKTIVFLLRRCWHLE